MISIRIVFSKGESLMIGLGMLLEHRLELSHKARLEITQGRRLDLRLSLIGALHVEKYTPQTTCPRCHHGMSPLEIIKGFRADPHDLTTSVLLRRADRGNDAWTGVARAQRIRERASVHLPQRHRPSRYFEECFQCDRNRICIRRNRRRKDENRTVPWQVVRHDHRQALRH
jgi:hypothetical protein